MQTFVSMHIQVFIKKKYTNHSYPFKLSTVTESELLFCTYILNSYIRLMHTKMKSTKEKL